MDQIRVSAVAKPPKHLEFSMTCLTERGFARKGHQRLSQSRIVVQRIIHSGATSVSHN
jgi:hypothetical protein